MRLDEIHPAEAHGEEHQRCQHPGAHAFEQPEAGDGDKYEDDDAVVGPWQPLAVSDQSLVQHAKAGEEQHAANQRHRHQFQHAVAENQGGADHERGDDARESGCRAEQLAAQRGRHDHAADGAAAEPGDNAAEACRLELAIPVELLVGGEFEAGGVHGHAHQRHQQQGKDVGDLAAERRPIEQSQIARPYRWPKRALQGAFEQQPRRSCCGSVDTKSRQGSVVGGYCEHHADRKDERVAPPLGGEVKARSEGCSRCPAQQGVRLQRGGKVAPTQFRAHHGHGREANRAADAGHETACHREGDEAHQIRQTIPTDQDAKRSGGGCAKHERCGGGDEQRFALGIHRGADQRHHEQQGRWQSGNATAEATGQGDHEAGGEVAEEDETHALRGIGCQRPREDIAPVGHMRHQKTEARGGAGGEGGDGLGGTKVSGQFRHEPARRALGAATHSRWKSPCP